MQQGVLHIKTPVIFSQRLANQYGKNFYFKLEALQPSASFKIRGIGKLCQHYAAQGAERFVSSSGGNAGIAVAYAGKKLNISTVVFIPSTSHQLFIDEIESYGAKVVVAGDVWDEANKIALQYANEHNFAFIPPFDNPIIWDGHATLVQELYDDNIKPDAIVVAVGGGGLISGVLHGLQNVGYTDVDVIAVETIGAESFAKSRAANKVVELDKITSKATSLGAKRITKHLLDLAEQMPVYNTVVSDADAEDGARLFARDKRILTELSAGAALSIAYLNHSIIKNYNNILVIVCGGVNTSFFNIY